MFCLMDVSASMGEREKDLAKRFFILLHLFLERKYERVDVVFIRHSHEAAEVDEQEFFMAARPAAPRGQLRAEGAQSRRARNPISLADWNVYCAQADGDNSGSDSRDCVALLAKRSCHWPNITPISGVAAGSATDGDESRQTDLWRAYAGLKEAASNFAMARVAGQYDIYPVFRRLFARQTRHGGRRDDRNDADARRFDHSRRPAVRRRRVGLRDGAARLRGDRGIARDDLGLDVYPNQIEIISAEQMLDAYSSVGMPLMYAHWSYGKRFVRDEVLYRKGYQALAYEIVINSNPCISCAWRKTRWRCRLSSSPTPPSATTTFSRTTICSSSVRFDPGGILDYLDFAKRYVAACEELHGVEAVESTLESASALLPDGTRCVPRHPAPPN